MKKNYRILAVLISCMLLLSVPFQVAAADRTAEDTDAVAMQEEREPESTAAESTPEEDAVPETSGEEPVFDS